MTFRHKDNKESRWEWLPEISALKVVDGPRAGEIIGNGQYTQKYISQYIESGVWIEVYQFRCANCDAGVGELDYLCRKCRDV
jgi:hypothetical protein